MAVLVEHGCPFLEKGAINWLRGSASGRPALRGHGLDDFGLRLSLSLSLRGTGRKVNEFQGFGSVSWHAPIIIYFLSDSLATVLVSITTLNHSRQLQPHTLLMLSLEIPIKL